MTIKSIFLAAALTCAASAGHAASVSATLTNEGAAPGASGTTMFRADLTGLGLSEIAAITVTDSNSGVGGSAGAYSGFDLDAIFLDVDGDATTVGDQYYASGFTFSAGTLRAGGSASNTTGPTNGSASANSVDEAFATLDTFDAIFFGAGSLTLGDGGELTALFDPEILVGPSLYLFVGEVGLGSGESLAASITVADVAPAVPLPAPALMLLSGLGAMAFGKRRKAKAKAA